MRNHRFSLRAWGIVLAVPLALILTTAVVLAWAPPQIAVVCPQQQDENQGGTDYFWTVTLTGQEDDYNIDWSTDGVNWNGPIDWSDGNNPVLPHGFTGPLVTTSFSENGGDHLYVRWSSDPDAKAGPLFNDCAQETPVPTPVETPIVTPSPTEAPSATPVATPVVTPAETPLATPTATIPNTAMELPNFGAPVFTFLGIVLIGLALMLLANAAFRKR
jgi:hypothetical protein